MKKYLNWLKVTLILFVIWLLLSGRMETKFLIMGICSASIIALLCTPALYIEGKDGKSKFFMLDINMWRFFKYFLWLFKEIVKSSLSVSKAIIKPKMDIQPQVIEFDWFYKNPIATTTLVNSIILTPGTLTADVYDEQHFVVHALSDSAAAGLLEGEMQRRIGRVFGEGEKL